MNILFLTNFYPPASLGGYEQWCQEVAEGLRNQGHEVVVLTSDYRRSELYEPEPAWIHRELHLEMDLVSLRNGIEFFTKRKMRNKESLALLRQLIKIFSPEVVLVWGMWNLPRSLPALAETLMPNRVAYYIGDYWPSLPSQFEYYWQAPARNWATSILKNILRPLAKRILAHEKQPALEYAHCLFPSKFIRDELKKRISAFRECRIIFGAIDTNEFQSSNGQSKTKQKKGIDLLWVGRLTPEKGVHTAIEAVNILLHKKGVEELRLAIVGSGDTDYEEYLRNLVKEKNVDPIVDFLGAQPKEAMPDFYAHADIFLFTSTWPEPFGRVIVEAMVSEMAVVGAETGGAVEIMDDGKNALTYPPGDEGVLAEQIYHLINAPGLRHRLGERGRQMAIYKFDIQRMTTEIEEYLISML